MKKLKLMILSLALSSNLAFAQQWCQSTISSIWTSAEGSVLALPVFRGDHLQICNIRVDWKGVTPKVCAAMFNHVSMAIALNKSMIWFYDETTPCNVIATYGSTPAPGYIMLVN